MSTQLASRSLYVATLGALLAVAACSDENVVGPNRPAAPREASRTVSVSDASVAMLSVEVSGDGVKEPLLYNLKLADGKSAGALATPAAEGRQLVVRGYDAQGNLRGTGTTAVEAIWVGKNEPVSVSLFAKGMEKPITASFDVIGEESLKGGSIVVDAPKEMREGETAKVRATVYDVEGRPMEIDPEEIHWAVSDPRLANIIPKGRYIEIEALRTGIVYLIAIDKNIATRRPIPVVMDPYVQVAAGLNFTCGRRQSGSVRCWGDNLSSQLGAATTQYCGNPSQPCSDKPVTVSGGRVYSSISSGGAFVCGIETNGQISCWGKNDKGQLGMGSIGSPAGSPVSLNSTATFTALTTGGDHSCAIANTLQHELLCWGLNTNGQLGDNNPGYFTTNPPQQPTPVQVYGLFAWRSIAAGREHTCGVTTNSRAKCWGSNLSGQLGTGPTNSQFPTPEDVNTPITANFPDMNTVWSGPDANGTCWLRVGPVPQCNGANGRGQAGVGGSSVSVNQPAWLSMSQPLLVISLGTQHACAVDVYENLFCWGDNKYGQIGIAPNQQYFLNHPEQVGTYKFSSVTSGGDHSCGLRKTGEIYCWGRNDRGQLGIPTTIAFTPTPTPIAQ